MKRHLFLSIFALCLIAAFSLVSCSRIEEIPDNAQEIQQPAEIAFTATLAPKGENPQTKAISSGTDDNGKEILNVAWAVDEKIALYYQTASGYAKTTAEVTEVNDGVATIKAELNANTIDGGTVQFVYPASLANETGDDIDEFKLLSQNGNLTGDNGISTKFDAATGKGIIKLSGGTSLPTTATVTNEAGTGSVSLQNRVCICKFHCHLDAGSATVLDEFLNVIINDGNGHTYNIKSDRDDGWGVRGFKPSDDIYIAMLPASGKTVTFYYTTKGSNQGQSVQWNYLHTSSNTTLEAGKFYRNIGTINLVRDEYTAGQFTFKDLSAGSITAASGDIIWQSGDEATSNIITIGDGAKVRLHGVNISATGSAGIICSGTATLILDGTNSVTTTTEKLPAILPGGSGTTLTIQGSGSVNAKGGQFAAGIGTGSYSSGLYTCGNIIISGGTVTATGGSRAAGIGSSYKGTFTSITITDGISSINATAGSGDAGGISSAEPIGKGYEDLGSGSVNIDGTSTWTAGTATTHLNWVVSTFVSTNNSTVTRWTLTHK